jgi:hypothetical protein
MVFHKTGDDIRKAANHPVPIKTLAQFERVSLNPGAATKINFMLEEDAFMLVGADGNKTMYAGERTVIFTRGNGEDVEIKVTL